MSRTTSKIMEGYKFHCDKGNYCKFKYCLTVKNCLLSTSIDKGINLNKKELRLNCEGAASGMSWRHPSIVVLFNRRIRSRGQRFVLSTIPRKFAMLTELIMDNCWSNRLTSLSWWWKLRSRSMSSRENLPVSGGMLAQTLQFWDENISFFTHYDHLTTRIITICCLDETKTFKCIHHVIHRFKRLFKPTRLSSLRSSYQFSHTARMIQTRTKLCSICRFSTAHHKGIYISFLSSPCSNKNDFWTPG